MWIHNPNSLGGWPLVNGWNRGRVVDQAIFQVYAHTSGGTDGRTGLCGGDATNVYGVDWGGDWCSEFAAWVLLHSGGTDSDLASTGKSTIFRRTSSPR